MGPLVTIKLAKDEGWAGKTGSKWKTMPQLMLMYRAGAWFGRTYAPELTMGLQTREEAQDVIDIDDDGNVMTTVSELRNGAPAADDAPQDAPSSQPAADAAATDLLAGDGDK